MLARWRPCSSDLGELYRRYCANKKENAGRVANYLRTMGTIWRALSRPKVMMMGQIAYLDAYAGKPDVPNLAGLLRGDEGFHGAALSENAAGVFEADDLVHLHQVN